MTEPAITRDLQRAARHLMGWPLTCAEFHPEMFLLVRLHEQELDRWFTQRLGYRLHTTATTARLYKSTALPLRRPLRTESSTKRPFTQREYMYLALILGAVAAGPRVISLHDLVDDVRSAAVEAGVELHESGGERRAFITAVRWMIGHGLVAELHERVDRYIHEAEADAIVEFDPDRIAMVPLAALTTASTAADVIDRSERRVANPRRWMRARLAEDPALYRLDLSEPEWTELRIRRADEEVFLDEMFDLTLETRAEGFAAIDSSGSMTDRVFPVTGTLGHAALLLVGELSDRSEPVPIDVVVDMVTGFTHTHRRRWAKDFVGDPAGLAQQALNLLGDHRLVELIRQSPGADITAVRALPASARYRVEEIVIEDPPDELQIADVGRVGRPAINPFEQDRLW